MAFTTKFLTSLGLTEEQAAQVFAERGKEVESEKIKYDSLLEAKKDLQTEYDNLVTDKQKLEQASSSAETDKSKLSEDIAAIRIELKKFKEAENIRIEAERKAKEDEILTTAVLTAIGEKEFVNDWTKNSIVNEIKTRMQGGEKDIVKTFEELTKDQEGIFKNPNPVVDIPAVGNVQMNITKEQYKSMGYADRFKLKTEQPELYKTFTE